MTLAAAAVHPAFGIVAEAVQEIEHGIGLRALGLIAGRRVDQEIAIVVGDGRVERMTGDRAARHAGRGQPGLRPGEHEHRLRGPETGLELAIDGIVDVRAVDREGVGVIVGGQHVARRGPHTLGILLHRQPGRPEHHRDLPRIRSPHPERHPAIGGDLGRLDRRRATAAAAGARWRRRCRRAGRRWRGRRLLCAERRQGHKPRRHDQKP